MGLSPRLEQTLILMVHGASLRQTAKALGVSPAVASNYRYRVRCKLDMWETADLLRYAIEAGLADLRRVNEHGSR